ncbi:hypothetical protein [Cellulomonas chengniuliangii]|uniref:Integral membrane protein n=2 Tax=Cellulomonas chengniuliangii TaxID=2968084 RepID=A0ABY5L0H0_9CELL|nr:hypothetical protein [Cellulomonas chengniuliangii]MCC2309847.1 hypothetical protein [Cellulomonas chengniuliangii]UUI76292.1 hypothetical protein NP064_05180 [Cellulomonas chengniuliangii]
MARMAGRTRGQLLALLAGSGVALVGLGILVAGWIGLGVTTLGSAATSDEPCLVAYDQEQATVQFTGFPPRAVCAWDEGGDEVVVGEMAPAAFAAGMTAAVLGAGATVAVGLLTRRRRVAPVA